MKHLQKWNRDKTRACLQLGFILLTVGPKVLKLVRRISS